jgi:hypothetical protein
MKAVHDRNRVELFLFAVLAAGLLCGAFAYAQQEGWKQFYRNSNGDSFYYEDDSMSFSTGSNSSARTTAVLARVRIKVVNQSSQSATREQVKEIEIDCSRRSYRILKTEIIDSRGARREEHAAPEWRQAEAGSWLEPLVNLVSEKAARYKRSL